MNAKFLLEIQIELTLIKYFQFALVLIEDLWKIQSIFDKVYSMI